MDLGGQREYLHSHGLFYCRFAVYALFWRYPDPPVALTDTELTETIVADVEPYLRTIQGRVPEAPVVVVVSQIDRLDGQSELLAKIQGATRVAVSQLQSRFPQVVEEAVFVSAKYERARNLDAVLVEEAWRLPGVGSERPASYRKLQRLVVDDVNPDGSESGMTFARPWGVDVPVTTLSEVYRVAVSKCGYSGAERNVSAPLTWLHNLGVLVFGGAFTTGSRAQVPMTFGAGTGPGTGAGTGAGAGAGAGVGAGAAAAAAAADITAAPQSVSSQPHTAPHSVRLHELVVLDVKWLGEVFRCLVTPDEHRTQYITAGRLRAVDVPHLFADVYPRELLPALMELLIVTGVVYPSLGFATSADPCCIVPYLLPAAPPAALKALVPRNESLKQVCCGSPSRLLPFARIMLFVV